MSLERYKMVIEELLSEADIRINGDCAWDIHVKNEAFYKRVLSEGSVGLGEAYMDGWWQCDALEEFSHRVIRADLGSRIKWNFRLLSGFLSARLFNLQSRRRAFVVGERHYDFGNDLFQAMLDRRMIYSCAYWKDARNLDQAQEAKLELVCRKLDLKPRMKVLDMDVPGAVSILDRTVVKASDDS